MHRQSTRIHGEGGYLIKMKPDEGSFDELWKIFRTRAEVEPIPPSPTPPPSPSGNWVGEGPIVVRGDPTRITWQNVEQRRLIVYRVVVSNATNTQIFDHDHGLGNFPQYFAYGGIGWVDCIPGPTKVVIVTNHGTLEFKPAS